MMPTLSLLERNTLLGVESFLGKTLRWDGRSNRPCAILGVLVANFGEELAVERLKDVAWKHRHPRNGANQLKWIKDETSWHADGVYGGVYYLIEPHTVEVLS